MSEEATAQAEVRRTRHYKVGLFAAPILVGLTVAACTGGSTAGSSESTNAATETHRSTQASPTPTPTVTERTPTPRPSPSNLPRTTGLAGCARYFDVSKYQNHEYEVCTAYVGNAAEVALQGLYKFGNSRIGYLSNSARQHFETRYWDQPRQAIERRVDSWPKASNLAGNKVKETTELVSVAANLQADRGLVKTRESWKVTASDGNVLYDEPLITKNITMCRGQLPGHPLHEWVVARNSQIPDFDCIGFDKSHGLKP